MTKAKPSKRKQQRAAKYVAAHFEGYELSDLVTVEKVFPTNVRPDLEAAIEFILAPEGREVAFVGISQSQTFQATSFSALITDKHDPLVITAPQFMDIDVGDDVHGQCITTGLWTFGIEGAPAAVLVSQISKLTGDPGVRVEMILSPPAGGRDKAQALLADLAKALATKSVYRGKALSFETARTYGGGLGALKVHRFPKTSLDQVILPKPTLDVLERTVFGFVKARDQLREAGFSTKRGLLLYGPPGTGKTHFIRYLISQLDGHTSLIVTAEQVGAFDEIMAIARALQPSVVVIEDADLLARARGERQGDCSQVLLNKLLNHMDGLTEDAEILFVLTTNRPETLEEAVRDRPGRIDQAIEIPRPDEDCRARLLDLYRGTMAIPEPVRAECVRRSEGSSAAFIREMARRMAQFALLRGSSAIEENDMANALEEMLGAGSFTATALGAEALENTG